MAESFYLFRRNNRISKKKTNSLIYYVQYINPQTGKRLTAKSTGQKTKSAALTWAIYHQDIVIDKKTSKTKNPLETFLLTFYAKDSIYQKEAAAIHDPVSETHRNHCVGRINNYIVPFFKEKGITTPHEVTRAMVTELRNGLRTGDFCPDGKELTPKTVNNIISVLKVMWKYLHDNGQILQNPLLGIQQLKNKDATKKGVFPIDKVQAVFLCDWNSDFDYMLCLLGTTTGVRNSEVAALTTKSLITINGIHFLDIQFAHETGHKTKTKAGLRKVPLHSFVFNKLENYITSHKIVDGDYIFHSKSDKDIYWRKFNKAVFKMALLMGFDKAYLEDQNISYYSLRHFYNSLLLEGKIPEYKVKMLMGHAVGKGMSANYYNIIDQSFSDVIEVVGKLFIQHS